MPWLSDLYEFTLMWMADVHMVLAQWGRKIGGLTFAQLANVQTVGIGLYAALAVVQAISSIGVAGLRRRATTLRAAVIRAKMKAEYTNMHRLQLDVSRLEIGFQSFNKFILWIVGFLFIFALLYFAYCTLWQDLPAGTGQSIFIFTYYLILPALIFFCSSILINLRCRKIIEKIKEAEKKYIAAISGL